MDKKRSSSEKHPISKKNAEDSLRRTKSNKGKTYKRIISPEETSSDELDNAYEFRTGVQNSRKEAPKKLEKKIRSYKSPVKQLTAKKNFEEGFSVESASVGSSRKQHDYIHSGTSCEEYQHKEAPGKFERKSPSSKLLAKQDKSNKNVERFSDESASVGSSKKQHDYIHSGTSCEEYKHKEAPGKSERKRISSKLLAKQDKPKKNVEEGFSGESSSFGSSRKHHDYIHSGTSREEYKHKEEPGKSERKRISSKLLAKQDKPKKNVDDISSLSRIGDGNTYKGINYCEESPTDDSVNNNTTRINVSTQDNRRKESPSSWLTLLSTNKTEKCSDEITNCKDVSLKSLCIDVFGTDISDDILDAGEHLKKNPASITLPSAFKSTNDPPFVHWGQTAETKRYAEDKKIEKDYTSDQRVPKLINKHFVDKEWERCRSTYEKQDKKKKPGSSKINNAEPETSTRHEGKDSEIDIKHKTDGTEVRDRACAINVQRKLMRDTVKKESENFKTLKNKENIELIRGKNSLDDAVNNGMSGIKMPSRAKCGDDRRNESSNSRTKLLKNLGKGYGELKDYAVESDTTDETPDTDEHLKEFLSSTASSDCPNFQESSNVLPYSFWGKDTDSKQNPKLGDNFKDDRTKFKDGALEQQCPKLLTKDHVDKEWCRFQAMKKKKDENRTRSTFKIEAEHGTSPETSSSRHEEKDSENEIKNITNGKEVTVGACVIQVPRKSISDTLKRESESSNIKDPNENIDLNISPTYSERKIFSKRRSDPSNALKENRPRPSI